MKIFSKLSDKQNKNNDEYTINYQNYDTLIFYFYFFPVHYLNVLAWHEYELSHLISSAILLLPNTRTMQQVMTNIFYIEKLREIAVNLEHFKLAG